MDNQYINLFANEFGVVQTIHAVQNDSGRDLICNIVDMQIPSGATAKFWAIKPSGNGIFNNATVSGNTVTVELTTQTLAEVGCVHGQLEIDSGGKNVKTFHFLIIVEKSYTGDYPESENESTYLDSLLEEMQQQLSDAIQQGESDIDSMITQAQSDINAAVSAAGAATTAANNAAGSANTAASSANAAAQSANKAAETAESVVDDIGNTPITFTQAAERTNLATGDTVKTAFGKIMKWFADLGAAAFQAVANNLTTTVAGSVLDARQGKTLSDNITAAKNALQTQIGDLEDLDTTAKGNVVAAVNELNSNKLSDITTYTTDILASALALGNNGVGFYNCAGSSYTGDIPNVYYGYGFGISIARVESIIAIIFPEVSGDIPIYNVYSGGTWHGWYNFTGNKA